MASPANLGRHPIHPTLIKHGVAVDERAGAVTEEKARTA